MSWIVKHCKLILYANDYKPFLLCIRNACPTHLAKLQEDLDSHLEWADRMQLQLSTDGCVVYHPHSVKNIKLIESMERWFTQIFS